MFELTDQSIDGAALRARLTRAEAGACTIFEGWVRNHHAGRAVDRLEYEAFDTLARLEGEAVVAEVEQAYPGCEVLCVHRTGSLAVGEMAVWIGATAPHRHAAFLACRQTIEQIKRRLPIWKKEHHADGVAEWVNCSTEAISGALSPENYYERQVALPEVGQTGQSALAAANVLVVGVGGLGCPAAQYLATAGVGTLTLADSGRVEASNLHRQILFTTDDVGASKTSIAVARLKAQNPFIKIEGLAVEVGLANVRALVTGRTAVLDCTDNFPTRFLLHDACRAAGVPLVQAAVHRFEGELNYFSARQPGCMHCLWSGKRIEDLAQTANCAGAPVFAPAVGVLGISQAAETLKFILGLQSQRDLNHTRLVDLLEGTTQSIERWVDPACPVCGQSALESPTHRRGTDAHVVLSSGQLPAIGPAQVAALLEPGERLKSVGPDAGPLVAVTAGDMIRLRELAAAGPLVLTCRGGLRSAALARLLRSEGWPQVYAQAGGSSLIVGA